jgi:hypothetical protein
VGTTFDFASPRGADIEAMRLALDMAP